MLKEEYDKLETGDEVIFSPQGCFGEGPDLIAKVQKTTKTGFVIEFIGRELYFNILPEGMEVLKRFISLPKSEEEITEIRYNRYKWELAENLYLTRWIEIGVTKLERINEILKEK